MSVEREPTPVDEPPKEENLEARRLSRKPERAAEGPVEEGTPLNLIDKSERHNSLHCNLNFRELQSPATANLRPQLFS